MRVLLTRRLPSVVLAKLEAVASVDVWDGDGDMPHDELLARAAGADAVLSMLTDHVTAEVFDGAPRLRVVANAAVGFNNIDLAAARRRGVVVTNTPDVLTDTVADFTWALILGLTRRLGEGERLLRSGAWTGWAFDQLLGVDLRGRQLGVVGFGRIGRAVASRAAAFGMRVAAFTRRPEALPGDVTPLSLDALLNTSDIVSLHVPLSDETRHIVDRAALVRMKRSAYLVNTSRGPVLDEEALAWALGERLIAGAALDVYEDEPAVNGGLLRLDSVLLLPHLGSATRETRTAMASLAADNVVAVLSGQPPLTPVP